MVWMAPLEQAMSDCTTAAVFTITVRRVRRAAARVPLSLQLHT